MAWHILTSDKAEVVLRGKFITLNVHILSWGYGPIKRPCCSCVGPRFSYQHPHGN